MLFTRTVKVFPILVTVAMASSMAATTAQAAGPGPVGRGTAAEYAVLGGSTVTNTGPSVLTGDLGLSPGTSITGFPPGTVNGTIHRTDAAALQAQKDLTTAYDDAAGRSSTATISADLGGQTLAPGVYTGAPSLHLTGTVTLDGEGDESAVFIFQAPASTLITASASRVALIRGAQACNVVWQVGSSATLGTGSSFKGSILALTSITVDEGTTVDGSTLARNGAVTLDRSTISRAMCSGAPNTATTGATGPSGDTTGATSPSGGTTSATGPNDRTTSATGPDGGTTGATGPDGGTTGATSPGATTGGPGPGPGGTTGAPGPNGEITTDTLVRRPSGPLAATGAEHSKNAVLSGLVLTGLGLAILKVTRRRAVR